MLLDFAYHIRSLERRISHWRQAATQSEIYTMVQPIDSSNTPEVKSGNPDDGTESDNLSSESDVALTLASSLRNLSLHKNSPVSSGQRHFGQSSNVMMIQTAAKIKQEILGGQPSYHESRRPQFWEIPTWQRKLEQPRSSLIFPEADLLLQLIELYFQRVQPYVPLLHYPSFSRSVSECLHLQDHSFGIVVLGVCAVASRYSHDPRCLETGTTSPHSLGWSYYKQMTPRTLFTEPPNLYDLQYCCLSVLYLLGTFASDTVWSIIGTGLRYGQEMGLHRKKKKRPEGQPAWWTVQSELCTRAYWVLINMDTWISISYGRPKATTSDDFDLELPMDCDDEYPSKSSFFIYHCQLLEIAGSMHRAIYSVHRPRFWKRMGIFGPNWDQKAVIELDSALNEWFASLPEHLKWDPNGEDSLFMRQAGALHAGYYWLQMKIHGQFFQTIYSQSRSGSKSEFPELPTMPILMNAAKSTVRILGVQSQLQVDPPGPFMIPIFNAAIVLLLGSWMKRNTLDSSKDMQAVARCLEIISSYEDRYVLAGRLYDIIHSVMNMGAQHFQTTSTSAPAKSDDTHYTSVYPRSPLSLFETVRGFETNGSSLSYGQNSMASTTAASLPVSDLFELTSFPDFVEPGSALPSEENWTTFMAQVDELLQSVSGGLPT
ncbi:fungal-specific transcription factor domain-containing protein [Rhodocollybia butyracea]|uniref:Fungal-specific transcription factor domain-containing protein n=1 Tax=Rhodocollybia butyracea TaxID=206335 RepID=A0A9P5PVS7_9AGAR|nr:fungal-specific transcription factor domain-containing protein [Rhodocollybia butyracea]